MHGTSFVFFTFIVFTGAAILATLALYTRQSLLVAYILLGVLFGPSGLNLVPHITLAREIGDVGVILLLFLLGLDLSPKELISTFRNTIAITIVSSIIFAGLGMAVGALFGLSLAENALVGASAMFSSTIIGLKLLPAETLHRKVVGEWMVSILLLQDILAILLLIFVNDVSVTGSRIIDVVLAMLTLPALIGVSFFFEHFLIAKLFQRFATTREYVFLLAIGWCLGLAELAHVIGLPAEIGAFIAGISIAEGPIAARIADSLKPLRDFCLVVFFFVIGASFNLNFLPYVWAPAVLLAGILLLAKPMVFSFLLRRAKVAKAVSQEIGYRLGQSSEFSLLIAYLASSDIPQIFGQRANYLIQAVTLITFIVSSYLVVLHYPTPVAFSEKMRRE